MKAFYILILFILAAFADVHSQELDASPAGVMISHGHPKGGWMASYSYMNMMMKNNISGTKTVSDHEIFSQDYTMSPQKMSMDMHMLMAMWGATQKLSFMLTANYQNLTMDMKSYSATHVHNGMTMTESGLEHTHQSSGLGDTKLWGLYKLLNGEGSSLVLSLGLSFPTGDYQVSAGEHAVFEGQHDSYMMQLGTGSYDFLPGITWLKKKNNLTWSAQLLGAIRPFDNPAGYHLGNEITLNSWAAYHINPVISVSLRAEAFASGSIQGKDDQIYIYAEPAANPDNYGGTRASSHAGINFYINKGVMRDTKIGIEYGIPFYQNLNGPQIGMQSVLSAGITKLF